jgi:hypothetical protein
LDLKRAAAVFYDDCVDDVATEAGHAPAPNDISELRYLLSAARFAPT